MIRIQRVRDINGNLVTHEIVSDSDRTIDAQGRFTLLPALIDPHVHFRTPGAEHKEDWRTGSRAAVSGGVTTVLDMPNNTPSCTTRERLLAKRARIHAQLADVGLPLRFGLYFGADKDQLDQISLVKNDVVGLKIYMGSTTGSLLMEQAAALEAAFRAAAESDILVAVHAENEAMLQANKSKFHNATNATYHPIIRSREAAVTASAQAIELAAKTGARLYLVHISTKEELDLIRQAKRDGLRLYGETTPNHLFLDDSYYVSLGTRAQMNPPVRTKDDQDALWEAVLDGTIDTIGTDHAPHTLEEKNQVYGKAPSGLPGVETLLPQMLDAHSRGILSLERLIEVTRTRIEEIFRLPSNPDVVLVDLEESRTVSNDALRTKCGWSPFAGRTLKGWPVATIMRGQYFSCTHQQPLYGISKSWSDNIVDGPIYPQTVPDRVFPARDTWIHFLGYKIASPLGVPAGPLLDARWTTLAGRLGFDIVTYKTIRSQAHDCHPLPNVVYVQDSGQGVMERTGAPLCADGLSITNSFGMPSMSPDYLRHDIARAKAGLADGQILIVSVVGTSRPDREFTQDFMDVAQLAAESGAHAVEANFSCPNVTTGQGAIYLDPQEVARLTRCLYEAIGPLPLILKVGVFADRELLRRVLHAAAEAGAAAVCGINTLSMQVQPPLDADRTTAGVCGAYIRPHALNFVRTTRAIIERDKLPLTLIGCGGVVTAAHVPIFLDAGADAVLSATGMMWNPHIALESQSYLRDYSHGRSHRLSLSH